MKKIYFPVLLVSLLHCTHIFSQAKLIEKVVKKGDEVIIPYEKYVLPNGLTVIVHEDHSDPVIHVDVTFHVGSAREEIGKSGFAHFFEHMLFQGSDHIGDDQHIKMISDAGGTSNGSTTRDRTNYYETFPSNQLEKVLWMEADRMGFFLDAVTQKKFEIQRSTVKNERGQRIDNVPYGPGVELQAQSLYPYGHPYSWMTIGYVEDLNRVDVNDLKNFFLRWYGPNNSTLTIGGDVNTAEVIRLVEKYFGSIKRGPDVEPTKAPPVVLDKDRFMSYVDNYARVPAMTITYPTVPIYHNDQAALACLAQLIGQGKNSVLYQQLTKKQLALSATAFSSLSELAGEFTISITPSGGKSLSDEWALYKAALDSFDAKGITDDDIEKFKGSTISQLINGLQSVSGKTTQLAQFQTFTGNANKMADIVKMYSSLTKADVMAAYNKYIKGKHCLVISAVTKGNEDKIAAANNYKIDSSGYTSPDYGYAGLKYVKGKDNFDRSIIPKAKAAPVVKVPKFWRKDMTNGVKIIGTQNTEIPVVTLYVAIPGGHIMQANDLSKAGLANLFAALMNEDTKNNTAESIAAGLQRLGSIINVNSDFNEIQFSIQCLKKNLDATLAFLEERMLSPNFTEAAFNRTKKQILDYFKIAKSQPGLVASNVFSKINYGSDNILGISQNGTEETVKNITIDDVKSYYNNYITSQGTKVVVVGDITQQEILPKLENLLNKLPNKKIELPKVKDSRIAGGNKKVYLVDVPKSAQSQFRIGYATGLKYDATGEYYKTSLANYPLGGDFNSRLNMNLRESKGWTYAARSFLNGDDYSGDFQFSSGIRVDASDSAVAEIMKEIKNYYDNGISEDELAFMKNSLGQKDALNFETGFQKATFMGQILDYNLPANYTEQQNKILARITKKELDAIIKKHLDPANMNILLVGDRAKIYEGVKKLGYEIIDIDVDGNKVERKGF